MLNLHNDQYVFVSVNIDHRMAEIGIYGATDDVLKCSKKINLDLKNVPIVYLQNGILALLDSIAIDQHNILGICVSIPDLRDVLKADILHKDLFNEYYLTQNLQDKFSTPVFICYGIDAVTIAEQTFGSLENRKNAIIIDLSDRIQFSSLLNGILYTGLRNAEYKFDYSLDSFLRSDNYNVFEDEIEIASVSGGDVPFKAYKNNASCYNKPIVFDNIKQEPLEDDQTLEIVNAIATRIGNMLAIYLLILDPGMVLFTGKYTYLGAEWILPVTNVLKHKCQQKLLNVTSIQLSGLSNARLLGGLALLKRELSLK